MFDNETFTQRYDEDATILALFREWHDAKRQYRELPDDEEAEAAGDRADAIEDQIYATSAAGLAGIMIKAFFLAHLLRVDELTGDDLCETLGRLGIDDYGEDGLLSFNGGAKVVKSFADDAARLMPELAPFVAGIANASVTLKPVVSETDKAELRTRAVGSQDDDDDDDPDAA